MKPNAFHFTNEPPLDFAEQRHNETIETNCAYVEQSVLGRAFGALIAGNLVYSSQWFERENPSCVNQRVGRITACGPRQAEAAVRSARNAQPEWAAKSVRQRAEILLNAANILRQRRYFFIALMMYEVGKPRAEADAEVCEAIDFLECYARAAVWIAEDLDPATFVRFPGEENTRSFEPLGVGVSIQPWNFPLAISAGPAAAALVTGNAVLYKPAEQSSVIGYYLSCLFHEAGVPPEVFHFLPGYGEKVGEYLVRHPDTDFVVFTGSAEVGKEIEFAVAQHNYEQNGKKKSVAAVETGGKNALIVDASADLDAAVVDTSNSAFGFAGQKCSALSRVIVHEAVYEEFVERLASRVRDIPVGPPQEAKHLLGPVIDRDAYDNVLAYQHLAHHEGTVKERAPWTHPEGHFVPPALITDVSPRGRLAQEEIFGPVLVALKARSFEEALEVANDTQYGLTGGIHSRNPRNIERAKREVVCGNFYVNRKITGSVVEQQPFGGVKLSGNGQQAGAWDYLLNFVNRKTISENIVRRGYAPLTYEP